MNNREETWQQVQGAVFDVAIIGGGISGASLYHQLCKRGYSVILIDKGDFACGTSQASAMMIWGGLLYLRNLDIPSVYRFSRDRDAMIREMGHWVSPRPFRYIPAMKKGRNRHLVHLCLYLYWLLGLFNRSVPASEDSFDEAPLLNESSCNGSLLYEEAFLNFSDSRFVLHWITSHCSPEHAALNYCALKGGRYHRAAKLWFLDLKDTLGRHQTTTKAKLVVNCAGVWTDEVNRQFHIQSPYRHLLSKGVFISFRRSKNHRIPLIFEMGQHRDAFSFIPWGPVSIWGPTETVVADIGDGFRVTPEDIRFLLEHANTNLKSNFDKSHIISLRCGIRPLAVDKSFDKKCHPLDISRHHKIAKDPDVPWIATYGGKITSCVSMAHKISSMVSRYTSPSLSLKAPARDVLKEAECSSFSGLQEKFHSLEWCMDHEFCCTLGDYLRRRTNISQWVPREGLGYNDENLPYLEELAMRLASNNVQEGRRILEDYRKEVNSRFDQVISKV